MVSETKKEAGSQGWLKNSGEGKGFVGGKVFLKDSEFGL